MCSHLLHNGMSSKHEVCMRTYHSGFLLVMPATFPVKSQTTHSVMHLTIEANTEIYKPTIYTECDALHHSASIDNTEIG